MMLMYTRSMDVAVTELRANLSRWLALVREGREVVVTERGIPVARLIGIESSGLLERLVEDGVVARPEQPDRPTASGRTRPPARRPVAERIGEQRR